MIAKIKIIFIFLLIPLSLISQINQLEEPPFQVGEELKYDASYEWGYLDFVGGTVLFSVDTAAYEGEKSYHFMSIGTNLERYDWAYPVRDTFQSYASINGLYPLYYKKIANEGTHHSINEIWFKNSNKHIKIELYDTVTGVHKRKIPYSNNIVDLQTLVYKTRSLDFRSAAPKSTKKFKIIVNTTSAEIPIIYEGIETIEISDKKISCFKIKTKMTEGTIIGSDDYIDIWLSADNKQIPILVEAPLVIGHIKAEIQEETLNKYF